MAESNGLIGADFFSDCSKGFELGTESKGLSVAAGTESKGFAPDGELT